METPPDLPQGPSTKLFLGGLPPGLTDDDLRDHFETFGKVDEAVVKRPQGTSSSQSHFGFLWVRPAEAARQIVSQDHTLHCASGLSVTIPAPVLARNTVMSTAWRTFGQLEGPPEAPHSLNHGAGCPELRPNSANQPLGPRWPATQALFSPPTGITGAPAQTSGRPLGLALQVLPARYPPAVGPLSVRYLPAISRTCWAHSSRSWPPPSPRSPPPRPSAALAWHVTPTLLPLSSQRTIRSRPPTRSSWVVCPA